MIKLYIIRHGQTDLNKPGIFFGNSDVGLNILGKKQCEKLILRLKNIKFDVLISSPLKRCIETAQYISSNKALPIEIFDELREMDFGLWEGRHYDEVAKLYSDQWTKIMNDWKSISPAEGESFKNFYKRVKGGLIKIIKEYDQRNVAVVTHSGCMKVFVSELLGLKEDGFWNFHFEHGKYSLLEIENNYCTIKKINC